MSLAPVTLDDLRWRDMVTAIRERIAAVSGERWTLHAPVDPGVTLLELFAYLLEQRVYWLDQVPPPLINAMIALLGAEPRPARAAVTLMEITTPNQMDLASGEVFQRREQDSPLRFTSEQALAVLPLQRIEVVSEYGHTLGEADTQPRWSARPLTLLNADHEPGEVALTLWLDGAVAPSTESASILLELENTLPIPHGWALEAVEDVGVAAEIQWRYSGPAGTRRPLKVEDGSQGLRRCGVVRYQIPADWTPIGAPVNGLTPYGISFSVSAGTFSAPPRLRRLVPNVVTAGNRVRVQVPADELEAQIEQWLPLPGLALDLFDHAPPLEDSVELRLRDRHGDWLEWEPVSDLARQGPENAVFTVDRARNRFNFGDGLTGRLPVARGPDPRGELRYLAGGGEAGNVGAGLDWVTDAVADRLAVNPVPARGGRESETSEGARTRVSAELAERVRAITASDFEHLTVTTPGIHIARAKAIPGMHPGFPCVSVAGAVSVFAVPGVPRWTGWLEADVAVTAPKPDAGALDAIRRRLDQRRLLTTEVFVAEPRYRRVEVEATLRGHPVDPNALEYRLRAGLTQFLDPLVGGPVGTGWEFGAPLRPSELTHQLQKVAGDGVIVEKAGVRIGSEDPFEDCVDLKIDAHDLVVLDRLLLHWRALPQGGGGLR
ncbi:MAG: putative baseplate assembly protein [Xanthomonadales bacterium]|nr:putative baseplate assembly protein [Xanthomonadales bacterium]